MTGHGESRCQQDGISVSIELRTINSRYFKVSIRSSEGYGLLDPQIEGILRQKVRRGTIQVAMRVDRVRPLEEYQINAGVLAYYRDQLAGFRRKWNIPGEVPLEPLLALPGVVDGEVASRYDPEADWPIVQKTLEMAIENLDRMRAEEGRAMAVDLRENCRVATENLEQIRQRSPVVIDAYRKRLLERVKKTLDEFSVSLDAGDLVREVSLFAERSDISEEIVRLQSHLEQFESITESPESSGRKLEFLIQEMFREANTIGSKSYDVEIARLVIEIKTAIERLREMIQNIE
jgi:uncharacterized protein (TIGR00255 family)